jgi:hypothetical protein
MFMQAFTICIMGGHLAARLRAAQRSIDTLPTFQNASMH